MIKPGSYRLSRDVQNPTPDRRHKDDWSKWPMWKAGTEFLAIEQSRDLPIDDPDLSEEQRAKLRAVDRYVTLRMVGPRFASLYERGPGHEEQYRALVDALEPSVESFDAMFERLHARSEHFARWLLESGRLDRETFERLWSAYEEDGHLKSADWPRRGRRLVEEPAAEEIGVESDLNAAAEAQS